jgi:E3 ubiquitin-protein ligase RNF115/126
MTMDDVITQLMEQGQGSTAPPPATNDAMESLPRYKADKALVDGGKECTVCKDNFSLGEDVVRLPCLHVL